MSQGAGHVRQATRPAGSVGGGRRRPVRRAVKVRRVVPPAACTTSAAVDEHALAPAMVIQGRARRQLLVFAQMWQRTTDPVLRELIARAAREAKATERDAAALARWLDGPVSVLADAEARCNWDHLAGLRGFSSGRKIASELIPLLDAIRAGGSDAAVREARAALTPWFETFGRELLRTVVLVEVGAKLRAPILEGEFERWQLAVAA